MKTSKYISCFALALTLALGAGCATGQTDGVEVLPDVVKTADTRIQNHQTVLRQLRESPFAGEVSVELDRVASWLQRSEALRLDPEKMELLELYIAATEGALVEINAFYSRREAESALESQRVSYEAQMNEIKRLRKENASILEGGNP